MFGISVSFHRIVNLEGGIFFKNFSYKIHVYSRPFWQKSIGNINGLNGNGRGSITSQQ